MPEVVAVAESLHGFQQDWRDEQHEDCHHGQGLASPESSSNFLWLQVGTHPSKLYI
jgi:hypothetical protein